MFKQKVNFQLIVFFIFLSFFTGCGSTSNETTTTINDNTNTTLKTDNDNTTEDTTLETVDENTTEDTTLQTNDDNTTLETNNDNNTTEDTTLETTDNNTTEDTTLQTNDDNTTLETNNDNNTTEDTTLETTDNNTTEETTTLSPNITTNSDNVNVIVDEPLASITFENSGGDITYCGISPALPSGLTFDNSTCKISGTPTTFSAKTIYTITATNSAGSSSATISLSSKQEMPSVVIRINLNDYKFINNETTWSSKIFGYEDGELNNYFNEISYSSFELKKSTETYGTQDGIITVTVNKNHPGNDIDALLDIINDAVALSDEYIDFSQYDTNNDGAISNNELQLIFILAGGESSIGVEPGIWAHSWCMYGDNAVAPTLDNVKLMSCIDNGSYSIFGERHGDYDATIGIIAHELGHSIFFLNDLYDIDYSSSGIGFFGLMSAGSWGFKEADNNEVNYLPGKTPVHMTAYSKIKAGFIKPIEVNSDKTLSINGTFNDYPSIYKIPTDAENEYFLIENRANQGFDRGLFALQTLGEFKGGILITHIDENQEGNEDETHKLVDVEEASGSSLDSGSLGDVKNLYYSDNISDFTPYTTPNSNTYSGNDSGIYITNISEVGDTMNLDISFRK